MRLKSLFLLIFFWGRLSAQSEPEQDLNEGNIPEELLIEQAEKRERYREHPLNINTSSVTELQECGLLSPVQIQNLVLYRHENGELKSLYELQSISGFDTATIRRIIPYFQYSISENESTSSKWAFRGHNDLLTRVQNKFGYQEGYKEPISSIGSPLRLSYRYTYTPLPSTILYFAGEKDAGEPLFRSYNRKGFDFYTANLFIQKKSYRLLLGDYSLQFGQGLALYSGYASSKSADALAIVRSPGGIRPYRALGESLFFRGIALTKTTRQIHLGELEWSFFISQRNVDAAIKSYGDSSSFIQSIDLSGYHRTRTEQAKRNTLAQHLVGLHVLSKLKNLQIGLTATYMQFSAYNGAAVRLFPIYPYQQQTFLAVNHHGSIARLYSFGEIFLASRTLAGVQGFILSLSKQVSLALSGRYYGKNYSPVYASPFRAKNDPATEKGFYCGFNITLNRKCTWNTYLDLYEHTEKEHPLPIAYTDILQQCTYAFSKEEALVFRYRYQNPLQSNNSNHYVRILWQKALNSTLNLRQSVEGKWIKDGEQKTEKGLAWRQEIGLDFSSLKINFQYILFETDGYASRLYPAEKQVYAAYAHPMVQGEGMRWSILMQYRYSTNYSLALGCSRQLLSTRSPDTDQRPKMKAQVRILF